MSGAPDDELLRDVRRALADASAEISDAVAALETDGPERVEDYLGSALSRLKILDERVRRRLDDP